MWKCSVISIFFLIFSLTSSVFGLQCSRYPPNTIASKSPVDENFVLSITENAQSYILGQSYNISLQSFNGRRFMSASVVLENSDGDRVFNDDLGQLEIVDPIETRYSPNCSYMIETTNMNYKTRLDMVWIAPTEPGKGCVLIRATVLQHRDVWYMDDGALTKQICEEPVDDIQSQQRDDVGKLCCACDEARYEISLESTWSRNLHPKDFPIKGWLTRYSDIMGAAHTSDYRFWDNGVLASPAMREFAEHSSTRGLERELNNAFKEDKVRTILKSRGPAYPYMNVPSVASMRVDPWHHQFSLASKIEPSPDWIVGVTGLELCLRNCTWLEETSINLYPWDVGTDAGPTYTSADQPQVPADVIRRMSSKYPADIRSPFYDEAGIPMKPLAVLTVKRIRLYDRKCVEEESNNPEDLARECRTHPWTEWSLCSSNCGQGTQYRYRVFKQLDMALTYNCGAIVENQQERPCVGPCTNNAIEISPGEEEEPSQYGMGKMYKSGRITAADCRLGDWGEWSPCNATCGAGFQIRQQELLDRNAGEECVNLEERFEYMPCFNRKCSDSRRMPLPAVGSNRDLEDNRGYNVNLDGQTDSRDKYYSRYNKQYDRGEGIRREGGTFDDPIDYNNYRSPQNPRRNYGEGVRQEGGALDDPNYDYNNYRSPQIPRRNFENQQRERQNSYDITNIDDQQQYNNYPYGKGRDQDEYDRQQRPQQSSRYNNNNNNNNNDYDRNRSPGNTLDYNRPQYSSQQYNKSPYGKDIDDAGDGYNRQRYGTQSNDLDDPIEAFGEPYIFPAESLKQDLSNDQNSAKSKTQFGQATRAGGDFQYLNSPVKDIDVSENSDAITSNNNPNSPNDKLNDASVTKAPSHCFQQLKISECSDKRTIGNYWFYNFCTDECMIYAVDICDHNMNRFTSLEECEQQCAMAARENPAFLLNKQQTADHCHGGQSVKR